MTFWLYIGIAIWMLCGLFAWLWSRELYGTITGDDLVTLLFVIFFGVLGLVFYRGSSEYGLLQV